MVSGERFVCQGRLSDGTNCGGVFRARPSGWGAATDQARAAGWKLGQRADGTPDAMCPRCGAPDPQTVQLCADLAKSVRR